jgi:MoaA/NifB/PqqE/SkfB family radical SAM enzyme|tara:strand:+ start:65 stop:1237 length:1173 start_codon:yes stop_codon:yes gene_type:complete
MKCSAPWRGLHIRTNGDISTCCAGQPLGNVHNDKFEDVLHNNKIKEVRQSIKDGELHPDYCKYCINIKKQNLRCELDWHNDVNQDFDVEKANLDYEFPTLFDARWNNTCNSSCLYCDEFQSSKWASIKKAENFSKTITKKQYLNDYFQKNSKKWKAVSLVGGEPLMIKENLSILEYCPEDVPIDIITNLSSDLSTSKVFEKLKTFKRVRWHISFDNVKENYEYVRQGSNWTQLVKNFKILGEVVNKTPDINHEVQIMAVLHILNITRLKELKDFSREAAKYFKHKTWPANEIEIVWQPLTQPFELDIQNYGKEFSDLFINGISQYLYMDLPQNEKAFFSGLIEQIKCKDDLYTQEKLKKSFLEWVETNAVRFNNVGTFEKLYPEYINLLK